MKHHYAGREPFYVHAFEPTDDEGIPEMLVRLAEYLTGNPDEMLLAEAGYPDAHVYVENGIFVEGAPDEIVERAFDILNAAAADLPVQGEPPK